MSLAESGLAISTLLQSITVKFSRAMSDNYVVQGVTPSQAAILVRLDEAGPQKVRDIATALNMAESNVSNICSRLQKAGLVRRQRQLDDQRVVKIELDESVADKVDAIKRDRDAFLARMQGHVTEADINDIFVGLRKLDRVLDLFLDEIG